MRARNRMIKPAFFQHGDLFDVEIAFKAPARIVYSGLWCWTDRERRFEWNPAVLKLNILPYDACWQNCGRARCSCTMERALEALLAGGFIYQYQVAGRLYGFLPTLTKHQSINRNEAESDIPAPSDEQMRQIELDIERRALSGGFHMYRDASTEMHMHAHAEQKSAPEPAPEAAGIGMHMHSDGKGKERDGEKREDQKLVEQQAARQPEQPEISSDAPEQPESAPEPATAPEAAPDGALAGDRVPERQPASSALILAPAQKLQKARALPLPAIKGKATVEKIEQRLAQVSAEIAEGRRAMLNKSQQRELLAEIVFTYWTLKHGHRRAIFDRARAAKIESRLIENDNDISELFYTLDGALKDRAIQGQMHDGDQKYDGIETIFRNRSQVERLAKLIPAYRKDIPHPEVEKYREAFNIHSDSNGDHSDGEGKS